MTIPSHGTLLQFGDGGGTEVFATVAKIKDISGPTLERGVHDGSTQTTDWGENVPGMKKLGPVTFQVNWIPTDTTHDATTGYLKDLVDGTKRNIRILWPDNAATIWQIAGFVTNINPEAPVDGILTQDVTFTPTGDPAPDFNVTP